MPVNPLIELSKLVRVLKELTKDLDVSWEEVLELADKDVTVTPAGDDPKAQTKGN